MAKDAKNKDNLISFKNRTESEQREIAKKGGKASGKARRQKAELRKLMQTALESPIEVDGQEMSGAEMIVYRLMQAVNTPESKNFGKALDTIIKLSEQDPTAAQMQEYRLQQAALRVKILENDDRTWTTVCEPIDDTVKEMEEYLRNRRAAENECT